MRADMSKVIVERPRSRITRKAGSWYPRGALRSSWWPDLEMAPAREAMGARYAEKHLNENLAPLVRFLRKQVGRPWSKVRAEISEHIRSTSAVQKHVLEHVADYVHEHTFEEGGRLFVLGRFGGLHPIERDRWRRRALYVCPRTGLLREAPPVPRTAPKPPDPDRRSLGKGRELRRLCGVWFEVELIPDGEDGAGGIARKRQLGSREIARLALRSPPARR